MRIRSHPSRDLARVHAFTRTVLSDHARLAEIHFAGDAFHERFRAGNNRCDLKRPLQKTLKKQCTHEMRTVVRRPHVVQCRSIRRNGPADDPPPAAKIDISLDSSLVTRHLSL